MESFSGLGILRGSGLGFFLPVQSFLHGGNRKVWGGTWGASWLQWCLLDIQFLSAESPSPSQFPLRILCSGSWMPLAGAPLLCWEKGWEGDFFSLNNDYMYRCEFLWSTNGGFCLFSPPCPKLQNVGIHGSFGLEATHTWFAVRIPTGLSIVSLL